MTQQAETAEPKIAAYLCAGCGLGERLNLERLAKVAAEAGAGAVEQHEMLCGEDGVARIRGGIQDGATHLVLGACSRRAKTGAFNFADDGAAVARVNLREGVIWTQPEDAGETTQEMADDYLRMGCAEAKFMRAPRAIAADERGANKRILVVGGGVSGMTAALEAARAGYEVLLVEKSGALGGWAKSLHRRLPRRAPFSAPAENDTAELCAAVEHEKNITVFLNAHIARTSGAPGRFSADIAQSENTRTENIGAIVQASGFRRYDASQLPEFAYGKTPDVVDQMELEALARAAEENGAPIARPSDGKAVQSVVFVQCAGQRSEKPGHLPYCSGCCCGVSIKQAMYFKMRDSEADANIIYTDLRAPGNGEDFYRAAQEMGVVFTNGAVERVEAGTNGAQLAVHFRDHVLDEDAVARADLVVLATGQVANSGVDISAVEKNEDGEKEKNGNGKDESAEKKPAQVSVPVESILQLDYRQGPDLPHLKHGFRDSHFICFPYETRRTGIYACGPPRRPMDMHQAMEDATGAALKAIQAVENAGLGRAAHPRAGDLSFPSFRRDGCTQCKRCTVECPFGAIDQDAEGYPQFNESRCRRCGTCMGACPVRVISFENYSVDTVGQQIKAIDMPDEFDEKPRILVLACENDAYPALDMAAHNRIHYNAFVRVIPIRCLGSVNAIWVTDALNAGFDGIMLLGCKKGDDYQCHFVTGAALAHERMGKIDDTLNQLQLEPERVRAFEVEITDIARVPQLINDYAAKIDEIGMNPFKGF